MNNYQSIALNHSKGSFDFLNKMGAGLPALNVTRQQVNSYWLIVKQQYNARTQNFKSFPIYEEQLKSTLSNKGDILFEDDYALVFLGNLPEFNLGRKVEASQLLVA